jgi:hypothetical protein
MTTPSQSVSVTRPVGQAIERVKRLLFEPFDLGQWFAIGFCAWLAILGRGSYVESGLFNPAGWHKWSGLHESLMLAKAWIASNFFWLLPLVGVVVSCIAWIVGKLMRDFVVPIQFLRGIGCLAAWRTLLGLATSNIGQFILYLLFRFVLEQVVKLVLVAVALFACCCCCVGCLLAIPYLGTVLRLPVLVFFRAYPAHYLAQYGTEWDVFAPEARTNST